MVRNLKAVSTGKTKYHHRHSVQQDYNKDEKGCRSHWNPKGKVDGFGSTKAMLRIAF